MAEKKPSSDLGKKPVYETQESLYAKAAAKLAADELMVQSAYRISNLRTAAAMFEEVGDYLDAPEKVLYCRDVMEKVKADEGKGRYDAAVFRRETAEDISEWERLAAEFDALGDYRDSKEQAENCLNKAKKLKRKHNRTISIVLGVIAALAVFAVVSYFSGFYRYVMGRMYLSTDNYGAAEKMFASVPGLLDSNARLNESFEKALAKEKIGGEITFGQYKWKILKREGDTVLLIASNIGESHPFYRVPFHDRQEDVSWADCSLREWLNTEILKEIFTDAQRERLIVQTSEETVNKTYGTSYSEATEDYLTLLSAEDIESGVYDKCISDLGHDYWLRTPGHAMDCAGYIDADHIVREYGVPVTDEKMMVRPVILVKCEK